MKEFHSIRYKKEQLGWTFHCTDCFGSDVYRPEGMEHLTFYEGHYLCTDCGKEVCYHDEDFQKIPEWIGDFGFNENQCCVYGEIQAFSYSTKNIGVHGSIARCRNGWTWATNANTRFTYTGAGGHSYGCFSDAEENVADTKELAEVRMLKAIIEELNQYISPKHGTTPAEAVREYTKAREAAEKQLKLNSSFSPSVGTQLTLF